MPADDGGTAPAADEADDDGLLDVSFPIGGGDSDPDDGAPPSPGAVRTPAAAGVSDERAASPVRGAAAADEGAALRCMMLSVDAHVRGRGVEEFAPEAGADPPTATGSAERDEGEGPGDDETDGEKEKAAANGAAETGRGWRPAPLPLPSWAREYME